MILVAISAHDKINNNNTLKWLYEPKHKALYYGIQFTATLSAHG